jgi:hypothetical protein
MDIFAQILAYGDAMYRNGLATTNARYSPDTRAAFDEMDKTDIEANVLIMGIERNVLMSDVAAEIEAYGHKMRQIGLNQAMTTWSDIPDYPHRVLKLGASVDQLILDIKLILS